MSQSQTPITYNNYSNYSNYTFHKHADLYHITLNISKNKIESILRHVLINFCQVNVMGYNNSEDYYWLKIKNESKIIPYIELELKLINSDENNTNIIFIAKTNNLFTKQRVIMNKIVKKFIEKFASSLHNYESNIDNDITL